MRLVLLALSAAAASLAVLPTPSAAVVLSSASASTTSTASAAARQATTWPLTAAEERDLAQVRMKTEEEEVKLGKEKAEKVAAANKLLAKDRATAAQQEAKEATMGHRAAVAADAKRQFSTAYDVERTELPSQFAVSTDPVPRDVLKEPVVTAAEQQTDKGKVLPAPTAAGVYAAKHKTFLAPTLPEATEAQLATPKLDTTTPTTSTSTSTSTGATTSTAPVAPGAETRPNVDTSAWAARRAEFFAAQPATGTTATAGTTTTAAGTATAAVNAAVADPKPPIKSQADPEDYRNAQRIVTGRRRFARMVDPLNEAADQPYAPDGPVEQPSESHLPPAPAATAMSSSQESSTAAPVRPYSYDPSIPNQPAMTTDASASDVQPPMMAKASAGSLVPVQSANAATSLNVGETAADLVK